MQNIPIFYDLYWKECFPNETEQLKQICMDIMQSDVTGGRRVSNMGGYQSHDTVHKDIRLKPLVDIIEIQYKQFHAELDLVDQVEFDLNNMWININFPGCHNRFHRHVNPPSLDRITSSSILSGTYYVNVPKDSGDLVFHAGREDYSHMTHEAAIVRIPEIFFKNHDNLHIRPVYKVKPNNGDLLLWFSDLIHGVEINKSDENRISISFNLGLKLK
jgi:uncharacterized protein (TIGR02466 family)